MLLFTILLITLKLLNLITWGWGVDYDIMGNNTIRCYDNWSFYLYFIFFNV